MFSRACSLGAVAVAAPVAIGMASLASSSIPLIATGLSAAALLGAAVSRILPPVSFLPAALSSSVSFFSGACGTYGAAMIGRAVLANPASIPAVWRPCSGAILFAARVIVAVAPFFLTLTLAVGALSLAGIAGAAARAALSAS